ncbi:MAG: RagB/SusD family nutrient uptake outer membrane protein [Tannerellaceae bacterium]|nr:RagB/SusD family nutrient uptake outer membrane protein [Tannerellaceae bacterium]
MKKNIIYILIAVLGLQSCVDLDQVPYSSLTPENFFTNEADARSAVISVYSTFTNTDIFNQFSETIHSQGTDDSEWGYGRATNNADKNDFDKFVYTTESNLVYRVWKGYYEGINRCNYAIENIEAMPEDKISPVVQKQLIAEAKFIRAYFYFAMVRYWGEVPLITRQTLTLDGLEVPKDPEDKIYAFVIDDLEYACEYLPLKSDYAASEAGRATKGAALAQLAKVYLTLEEWQKVIDLTTEVMGLGYALYENYADNFDIEKENGIESLFEIQYLAGDGNAGSVYNGYFRPPFVTINGWAGYGDNPVTKNLYDAYGTTGDLRRDVNIRLYTREEYPNMDQNIEYPYYCNKYIDLDPIATRSSSGNNHVVLRYADVLLMRAEALGRMNPASPEAYTYLNQVRRRAYGVPMDQPAACDVTPVNSVEEFVEIIIKERRLEFAFEAHRRFDLLRTKKLKEAMMAQNPEIGAVISEKHYYFPVPQTELDANRLLEQHPLWK